MSDAELAVHVRERDKEAYIYVVERYQAALLRYATALVRDQQRAADVVQQAFIKAYTNLRSYDQNRKFSSWLYRITRNEAMSYLRKHRREITPDDEAWLDDLPSVDDDFAQQLASKELRKEVATELSKLPRRYRDPLVLYYVQDADYKEISEVLRIPVPTVATRLRRGKEALAQAFKQQGVGND